VSRPLVSGGNCTGPCLGPCRRLGSLGWAAHPVVPEPFILLRMDQLWQCQADGVD
jgi:hypothetical protein